MQFISYKGINIPERNVNNNGPDGGQDYLEMEKINIDLKIFTRIYQKNLKEGKESFTYKGSVFLTSYAKYLIEYLNTKHNGR